MIEMCSCLWRISSLHGGGNGTDLSSFLENCPLNHHGSHTTEHFIVPVPLFSFQSLLAISICLKHCFKANGTPSPFNTPTSVMSLVIIAKENDHLDIFKPFFFVFHTFLLQYLHKAIFLIRTIIWTNQPDFSLFLKVCRQVCICLAVCR